MGDEAVLDSALTVASVDASHALSAEIVHLAETARAFAENAKAVSTRRAYEGAWADYCAWCKRHGFDPTPSTPQQVALYLSAAASERLTRTGKARGWSSIQRRLSALGHYLRLAGGTAESPPTRHPIVREVVRGIRRAIGVGSEGAPALTVEDLRRICCSLPDTLRGTRDRALLLLCYGGAFRRSELAGIEVEHLTFSDQGVTVFLPSSKTDQERRGVSVPIVFGTHAETCPVAALRAWLQAAAITTGPVFRAVRGDKVGSRGIDSGGRLVSRVLQRAATAANVHAPKTVGRGYSAHSMRAGFVTAAAKAGEPEWAIMRITRHRSSDMVRRYIRGIDPFGQHPGQRIGL